MLIGFMLVSVSKSDFEYPIWLFMEIKYEVLLVIVYFWKSARKHLYSVVYLVGI